MTKRAKVLLAIAILLAALNFALFVSHAIVTPSAPDISQIQTQAEAGDPDAQLQLYFAYKNGRLGLEAEPKTAITWLRKAAEQNSSKAQNLLGIAYEQGTGVEQSYAEALVWYMKAANGGNANGQGNVGRMFDLGLGVQRDAGKAIEWYRKGAENGSAESQHNLGNFYLNGDGVERNDEEAFKWFQKAADQMNFGPSQANLAHMFMEGRAVKKNYEKAGEYYRLAGFNGVESARQFIESSRKRCLGDSKTVSEAVVPDCLISAGAGDAEAQFTIGTLHDSGTYLLMRPSKCARIPSMKVHFYRQNAQLLRSRYALFDDRLSKRG